MKLSFWVYKDFCSPVTSGTPGFGVWPPGSGGCSRPGSRWAWRARGTWWRVSRHQWFSSQTNTDPSPPSARPVVSRQLLQHHITQCQTINQCVAKSKEQNAIKEGKMMCCVFFVHHVCWEKAYRGLGDQRLHRQLLLVRSGPDPTEAWTAKHKQTVVMTLCELQTHMIAPVHTSILQSQCQGLCVRLASICRPPSTGSSSVDRRLYDRSKKESESNPRKQPSSSEESWGGRKQYDPAVSYWY